MEIYTLVKAGIRNRKGIMTGFMILTMTIVVCLLTMIGVRKNYELAKNRAFDIENKGSIFTFFSLDKFSEKMENDLKNDETVDHILVQDALTGVNISSKDKKESNSYVVMKGMDTVPIFDSECKSLYMPGTSEYDSMKLKKGEIYVPYGIKDRLNLNVNDIIHMDFLGVSCDFKVKGFIQECFMGSSIIGYKIVYISDEEFDEISEICKNNIKDPVQDGWVLGKGVFVFGNEKANESSNLFERDLTLKYKYSSMAQIDITRETAERYTGIFIEIILAVITGFSILLFVIFLIVAGHNIGTEMEIDYATLGILKSQGFTDKKIRMIYIFEYLLVELVGMILGVIISIPLERLLSSIFFGLTAILPEKHIPILESIVLTALLFMITFVYVFICTRNVTKATPVKAITNAKTDYYFDSMINAPIKKRLLGFTLGMRQITSKPVHYISVCIVTALLVFTVITCELMSGFIQSRNALLSMGEPFLDIEYDFKNPDPKCKCEDIENIVKKYTEIKGRSYASHTYVSVNGESILVITKGYPDELSSVYKGRNVKYDNEIIVTEQICKLLDVKMGDTVTVGCDEFTEEYVIVGIFQSMNDAGKSISMSLDGISRLKNKKEDKYTLENLGKHGIVLKDASLGQKIVDEVTEKYGDDVEIKLNDFSETMNDFGNVFYMAADGSKLLIYSMTFIFALVTVAMVCAKAFIQERTDIGIYRAIGFGVGNVRRQFASRFVIISFFSSCVGVIFARLYSGTLLGLLFSLFGIPHIEMEYRSVLFIRPVFIFLIGYFIFGYIASGKVKKVSSRELITE